MTAYSRVAPLQPAAVRRARQTPAERQRTEILRLVDADGPHGVPWLAEQLGVSVRTAWSRVRALEQAGEVATRRMEGGVVLVGRPSTRDRIERRCRNRGWVPWEELVEWAASQGVGVRELVDEVRTLVLTDRLWFRARWRAYQTPVKPDGRKRKVSL